MPLIGADKALQQMQALGEGFLEGAHQATFEHAQDVMLRSQQLCPVGEGPNRGLLRDSAKTEPTENGAVISYQATDAEGNELAVKVHERLDLHHPGGGQAKFLQSAVDEAQPDLPQKLGETAVAEGKRRAGL